MRRLFIDRDGRLRSGPLALITLGIMLSFTAAIFAKTKGVAPYTG